MKMAACGSNFVRNNSPFETIPCSVVFHSLSTGSRKALQRPQRRQLKVRTAYPKLRSCAVAAIANSQTDRSSACLEIIKVARKKFSEEVSFFVKDSDISLAKVMLLVAAEDEAFLLLNRERDIQALRTEGREIPYLDDCSEKTRLDSFLLAGKTMGEWHSELDMIAERVQVELISKDIGCHLAEVLEAVNFVLFDELGFCRLNVANDPKQSYLHTVLNSACGTDILLSLIYIEVCQRLGVAIVGAGVGEDFLIWPQTENTEVKCLYLHSEALPWMLNYMTELFRLYEGESWFARVNGSCVKRPGSKAFDLNGSSLPNIETGSKRDIIVVALANLKRLYWKQASRAHPGLLLTSPLRPLHLTSDQINRVHSPNALLLRPQELSLAIMASERLLILQPDNWALRRDHGMLLYYCRRFGEALQELSICMAFAPVEEAQILEQLVEKLHLMRVESSWTTMKTSNTFSTRT